MLFKDLKNGYPLYVFDRSNVKVIQGKVISVGIPHIDAHYGNPTEMVVDINVDIEGQSKSYAFKDGTDTGYTGDLVISTGRDAIIREVEAMKAQSEQVLSQVDTHKSNIEKCTAILAEFNPVYKERKETEERFSRLEDSVGELKDIIKGLVKELKG